MLLFSCFTILSKNWFTPLLHGKHRVILRWNLTKVSITPQDGCTYLNKNDQKPHQNQTNGSRLAQKCKRSSTTWGRPLASHHATVMHHICCQKVVPVRIINVDFIDISRLPHINLWDWAGLETESGYIMTWNSTRNILLVYTYPPKIDGKLFGLEFQKRDFF